jgi:hypothetical protein
MKVSSVNNAMPNYAKSPACVKVKRCQAVQLEVEGKSIAVGHPKCQAASKVTHTSNPKGKRRKGNAPPGVPPPVNRETDHSSSVTTFPVGLCCLGERCIGPQLELWKHCTLCDGWVHVCCGQVLVSEEVSLQKDGTCVQLESDMVICQNCNPPRSSEDQVSDGAHKLVFVMHSGDAQEVSASDVVLDCSTAAILDVAMEQLAQAAVEHQHQIVTANEDDNEEQQV